MGQAEKGVKPRVSVIFYAGLYWDPSIYGLALNAVKQAKEQGKQVIYGMDIPSDIKLDTRIASNMIMRILKPGGKLDEIRQKYSSKQKGCQRERVHFSQLKALEEECKQFGKNGDAIAKEIIAQTAIINESILLLYVNSNAVDYVAFDYTQRMYQGTLKETNEASGDDNVTKMFEFESEKIDRMSHVLLKRIEKSVGSGKDTVVVVNVDFLRVQRLAANLQLKCKSEGIEANMLVQACFSPYVSECFKEYNSRRLLMMKAGIDSDEVKALYRINPCYHVSDIVEERAEIFTSHNAQKLLTRALTGRDFESAKDDYVPTLNLPEEQARAKLQQALGKSQSQISEGLAFTAYAAIGAVIGMGVMRLGMPIMQDKLGLNQNKSLAFTAIGAVIGMSISVVALCIEMIWNKSVLNKVSHFFNSISNEVTQQLGRGR